MRIGELSRRVGVSPETLRAWERRYDLPCPLRAESGYRLYSAEDEARVRELTRLRAGGVATAEAARLAREDPHLREQAGPGAVAAGHAAPSQAGARVAGRAVPREEGAGASASVPLRGPVRADRAERLRAAFERFDEGEAHAILDQAASELPLSGLVEEVVLPALRDVGERWERGEVTPAQEHFASNVVRGRLLGLSRGWGAGSGPVAILACPSGERHDLALIAFGLLLRERGWRIVFLGQDTPAFTIAESSELLEPDAIVIAALDARKLRAVDAELEALAASFAVYIAGAGASRRLARRLGAVQLEGEPTHAAGTLDAARSGTPRAARS